MYVNKVNQQPRLTNKHASWSSYFQIKICDIRRGTANAVQLIIMFWLKVWLTLPPLPTVWDNLVCSIKYIYRMLNF